jgi:hypothetical protein
MRFVLSIVVEVDDRLEARHGAEKVKKDLEEFAKEKLANAHMEVKGLEVYRAELV